ncbi:MAG: DNA repair protein RecN [Lachnospiraceae bacterium]|nr:DNA repair protein RecN [Lachnospiraceae bacterium]
MLLNIHVKNVALIDEADVELAEGLNVLSGETGAGKSILIDAVNLALGERTPKELLREGETAFVQLLFTVDSEEKGAELREADIEPEDDAVLLSRQISGGRSICRINDEIVTAGRLKTAARLLLDIHGQHEHQSLLYEKRHLEILDAYGARTVTPLKEAAAQACRAWKHAKEALAAFDLEESARLRETDLLRYEIDEIRGADLRPGEEEELAAAYRKASHARGIAEAMERVNECLSGDSGASEGLSGALRALQGVTNLDPELGQLEKQLLDVESILGEAGHAAREYADSLTVDEEELYNIEKRLDRIRALEAKYGNDEEAVLAALAKREERLAFFEDYEERKAAAERDVARLHDEAVRAAEKLTEERRRLSAGLVKEIREALLDLNFLDVRFEMAFTPLPEPGENGMDRAEFLTALNPGAPLLPLARVASGGELSRIMLAIKTVLAQTDDIPTLIFDEIDTGISGRTAQKVAEKLAVIARHHQVICITHLAQIAAMADAHYLIEKSAQDGRARTRIARLSEAGRRAELARILGGAQITSSVEAAAEEMLSLARRIKEG